MWLMDQPLVILGVGGVFAAALLGGLAQTRRTGFLWGAVVVCLLTAALLLCERTIITPREEVKATLYRIAGDLEQNDIARVLGHISSGKPNLRRAARSKLEMVEVQDVAIKRNLTIELNSHRGMELAEARFNATFRLRGRHGYSAVARHYPQHLVVRFRREDGAWRVRDYELTDPRDGLRSSP